MSEKPQSPRPFRSAVAIPPPLHRGVRPAFTRGFPGGGTVFPGVETTGKVEQTGRNIDMGDHGLVPDPLPGGIGIVDDERDPKRALVHVGFCPGEGHPMVGREHDQGLLEDTGLLEYLDQAGQSLVDARAGLIVLPSV